MTPRRPLRALLLLPLLALLGACGMLGGADADAPVLTGVVTHPDGTPLADVEVNLYGGFATRWGTATTSTDADGRYRFVDPQGARVRVQGRWDQYVGVCVGSVRNINPPEVLPWQDVTVPSLPGTVVELDFVFDPESVPEQYRN